MRMHPDENETPRVPNRMRLSRGGNETNSAQPTPSMNRSSSSTYDAIPTPSGSEIYLPRNYDLPPDPTYNPEPTITDPVALNDIFDECIDMYKTHKITPQNAFSLKLIECFDGVLNLDGFDKSNMQKVGRTLEVGTKIFSCRVEHTHHTVFQLAGNVADKKTKTRGDALEDERDEGVDVSMNGGHGSDDERSHNETTFMSEQDRAANFEQLEDGAVVPTLTFWGNDNVKNKNKNIVGDVELDMELDETVIEDSGELRRLKLKESFDDFVRGAKKFDYSAVLFGKAHIEEKRQDQPATKLGIISFMNPIMVNISSMGHMNTIGFLRFGKDKYDSDSFDIWGNPLNAAGINKDDNMRERMLEKRRQLRERLSFQQEDLMTQHTFHNAEMVNGDSEGMDIDPPPPVFAMPEGMERDYDEGPADMHENQENFDPLDDNGVLRQEINIQDITTLDDWDRYYDAMKNFKLVETNIYGWVGPNFIRNRRPRNKPIVKKKKAQPGPVKLLELDWTNQDNRFVKGSELQTELDDEVIKKWSSHKPFIPFMGDCEDEPEVEDDFFNDAFEGAFFQKNGQDTLPRILKYFIDHNRDLFEGILSQMRRRREGGAMGMDNQGHSFAGDGIEHDDGIDFAADVSFHNDNPPAPPHELEGIRELQEDFAALGANEDFMCEGDLDIMRRYKMLPSGAGLEIGSEAEEYPLSRFSDADSLKYARRPKPINISKVKDCITTILKGQLHLDDKGCPTRDTETSTDMMKLMVDMFQVLDENTLRYLTLAITLVATLHVTVDMRLFLDSGRLGSIENPRIICHGKKWVHADHIPGITCDIRDDLQDMGPMAKKSKLTERNSLRRIAEAALEALTDSGGEESIEFDNYAEAEKENQEFMDAEITAN